LGIQPGASQKEIDVAYKKKAKMYHPDRVASLAPEVREMAEFRMKEINAAYAELKCKVR
jgi:DnaJ like chaperone protein